MSSKGKDRSLEETPTWAVAVVCFVLVAVSIVIEQIIHIIGKWLKKRNKNALFEALEKIKAELMLLGFISLLLTVGQGPISDICVSKAIGNTWLPCNKKQEASIPKEDEEEDDGNGRRRLLSLLGSNGVGGHRRVLAAASYDKCGEVVCAHFLQGKVPFVSFYGIHQLHIFIFVLAVSHVLYCITTLALGRAKMRKWKGWEKETRTTEYQFSHDPERFRFARETSFGRRHLSFWSHSPILLWLGCFLRQFVRSVPKVDYMTLRHGFITAHLAPQSQINFDFQMYIKRSLEEDFKVVVGISPPIWCLAVVFLLFNTNGWRSYLWLPFIPLIIILLVGTKLQVIITMMGLRIQERGEVVKGTPVVKPADDLFWFNRPRLLLYLIHFVLFQNAFQLAFFAWAWYSFGLRSCFHERTEDLVIRISMGLVSPTNSITFYFSLDGLIEEFCKIHLIDSGFNQGHHPDTLQLCYSTSLCFSDAAEQMGSSMKPTIFNERVAKALHNWHQSAKKHIKQNRRHPDSVTPLSSRPSTPKHGTSPVHLLHYYRSEVDSIFTSPRISGNYEKELEGEPEGSALPSHNHDHTPWSHHNDQHDLPGEEGDVPEPSASEGPIRFQHEIHIPSVDFSFDKRLKDSNT
ncbi:hypothetical protein RJ640_007208 [Escallonia rubra]|uniref:MLO-like protein n=1 Tax=Escallonia rubra TaxID=112253 RepID=A0AA88QWI2_9ASTE|nr:hypothetical protein RJ640_007208 [Escallonia rubra]